MFSLLYINIPSFVNIEIGILYVLFSFREMNRAQKMIRRKNGVNCEDNVK